MTREVEHLIIGAGIAGLVLRRFLGDADVAIVDPAPAGYKIGESLIPELFRHPELAALLPRVRALPSYTPKHGTTFVGGGEVAYFPIGSREIGEAMHVARSELEQVMIDAWAIDVTRGSVGAIDFERKQVETTAGQFRVRGLILDCSGPAMLVASKLGEVENLLPVHATWAYYDVVAERPAAIAEHIESQGWSYLQYDVRHRCALSSGAIDTDAMARTTYLTRIDDGLWSWQIPLMNGRLLSYGLVSRHGPVDAETYRRVAEANAAPHLQLCRREGSAQAFDRIHERNGFARRAKRPAARDFILLADAFGFSDPVYSVGTGFAVSQAIEVAGLIERGEWGPAACERYVEHCRRTLDRARRAFEFWYSGDVVNRAEAAEEVQRDFLLGGLFQSGISEHYGAAIDLASSASLRDPFEAAWEGRDLLGEVTQLLELDDAASLAGWTLVGARPSAGGVQLRWTTPDLPNLTLLISPDPSGGTPAFRRAGVLALAYMQLFDRPYPATPALSTLCDRLAARIQARESDWLALATEAKL